MTKRLPRWSRWSIGFALLLGGVAFAATWLTPEEAECDDPALCRPQQTRLSPEGYLRAVSLDVRGYVPSPEEYAAMAGSDEIPEEMLEEWLSSEDFVGRVVRRHRALLWPNIENVGRLFHFRRTISSFASGGERIWRMSNGSSKRVIRGEIIDCVDEPATFDADGEPVLRLVDGVAREGWVEVNPFWAPDTTIRVCALDARERRYSSSGTDCSTRGAINDAECGCGPKLRWCIPGAERNAMLRDFGTEVEQRVAAHVRSGEPYHQLLTSRRSFVNGRLAFYYRNQTEMFNAVSLTPLAVEVDRMPDIPYVEGDNWQEIELPEGHAGLLTSPAYLLRFQTNRSRANRFYDAFLCQPFQPPPGGIPLDDELAAANPDVQQRPGCNYCHAILEPAAAHWGRWAQQGGGFLNPELFPEFRQECADCGRGFESCSDECRFHYVTSAVSSEEEAYLGMLRSFEFLRSEHQENVNEGPSALVRQGLADGRFTSCSVTRTAEWLLGRELREDEQEWTRDLTTGFLESDFSYRDLVRAIVRSRTYRRAL